jgi:hypothetical protein
MSKNVTFVPNVNLNNLLHGEAQLEKPATVLLHGNFPAVYGTRSFITMFTGALHWSLS